MKLHTAGEEDCLNNDSHYVENYKALPLRYVFFGHNVDNKITHIELVMSKNDKIISEDISNEEYYIKVFRFKRNDDVKIINYYDKDNNLIMSKAF